MAAILQISFFVLAVLLAGGFSNAQELAHQCVTCNSELNVNCLFRPETHLAVTCPGLAAGQLARCFSRLTFLGGVERGCINTDVENNECIGNATCTNCANVLAAAGTVQAICNRNLEVPVGRIRCHTCEGDRFGICGAELPLTEATFCPLHDAAEQRCFTRRSVTQIVRGCRSNTTLCADESECLTCQTNGCNSLTHLNEAIPWASSASMLQLTPLLALGSAAFVLAKKF